jgi:hypothetical protein
MQSEMHCRAESLQVESQLSIHSVVVVAKGPISCDLVGETIILDLRSGVYYGLDPVGTRIWSLIQRPISVTAIREALLGEYDVEVSRCERDLLRLLGELAAHSLIEVKGERAA